MDALDVVFSAIDSVWALFVELNEFFDIWLILIGFFVAFTLYRFLVRPLVGGGFVDPTEVLRASIHAQKSAESDVARKNYMASTQAYRDSRAAFYKSKAAYYDSKRKG